jgi:hypothetical protein
MFKLLKRFFGTPADTHKPRILFHGGCHGCTQQQLHGTDFCFDCQYFGPDWSKPNLNNSPPSQADIERLRIVAARSRRA